MARHSLRSIASGLLAALLIATAAPSDAATLRGSGGAGFLDWAWTEVASWSVGEWLSPEVWVVRVWGAGSASAFHAKQGGGLSPDGTAAPPPPTVPSGGKHLELARASALTGAKHEGRIM
jgi:hypothetical protein